MVHAAPGSCLKLYHRQHREKKKCCRRCIIFINDDWSDGRLKNRYGKAKNVPCDFLQDNSAQPPPPSPSSTFQRTDREVPDRPSFAERVLATNSGADPLGFTAGPANGAMMEMEMSGPSGSKKANKKADTRKALETLAGGPVILGRGGKSRSAVDRRKKTAREVTGGAAKAISRGKGRDAEREALDMMEESIRQRRAELDAAEAAEAAERSSSSSSSSSDDDIGQQQQEQVQEQDQQPSQSGCEQGCTRCAGGNFVTFLDEPSSSENNTPAEDTTGSNIILDVELESGDGDDGDGGGDGACLCSCSCPYPDSTSGAIDGMDGSSSCTSADAIPAEPLFTTPESPLVPPSYLGLDEPPARLTRAQKEEWRIWRSLPLTLAQMMVELKPLARRPFLAAYTDHPKPAMERVLRIKIRDDEWNAAKKHAISPGPFKPVEKAQADAIFRCKINQDILTKLAKFLEGPGVLQRYAFGERIIAICGGSAHVVLDNVDRLQLARTVTMNFILSIDAELAADQRGELPPDAERCRCIEQDTLRRCMRRRGHKEDGTAQQCQFTADGSIGRSSVLALVNTLTGNDIKKLSGLDDTRVLKGRDNFIRARRVIDELNDPDMLGITGEAEMAAVREEATELKKRIDKTELFYQVEFSSHVESQAEYECCCLECGFFDSEGKETIACPKREKGTEEGGHQNSCNKCSDMYAIIEELREKHATATARDDLTMEQQQELDQLGQDIIDMKSDLDDYRSHLARQAAEDAYDQEEIRNLPDDTVRVTSDWKHKIMECYFRENMQKYFGKRGIHMIGFMLMWNSTDPEEKEARIKEVRYVMMITDDIKTKFFCRGSPDTASPVRSPYGPKSSFSYQNLLLVASNESSLMASPPIFVW